ncbi:MAG TPA: hypothetical protein VGQ37_15980 [Vicinamibacterales bacterium]|nr:hypothetical protein [Vicinamibacterales bacterium]
MTANAWRAAAGLVLAVATAASAQAPPAAAPPPQPPIAGTWKLNPQKSGVQLPPDYVEIRQYRLRPDGYLVGLLFNGDARGLRYLQFTAKSDGKDYPEHSDQIVANMIAAGTPTPRTYSETKTDEYTTAWIDKVDGKITAQGRKVVSKDGQTLTITIEGQTAIRVYDRQQ